MGDLLDLILDFERRLILLIKDLVRQPQALALSISEKRKDYISAFKFYSLVASLWVVCFQFGNRYLEFFDEDFVLPTWWVSYIQSQQSFAFLMTPFTGLITIIIPLSTANWLLFRKDKLSWLNHINLNIYAGGLLMLYALPWFFTLYTIGTFVLDGGEFLNYIAYVFLLALPLVYYSWVHVKIFNGRAVWKFVKPFVTIIIITWCSLTYLIEPPWLDLFHRKIFYSTSDHPEMNSIVLDVKSAYLKAKLVEEKPDQNLFIEHTIQTELDSGFAVVQTVYDRHTQLYSNHLVFADGANYLLDRLSHQWINEAYFFSVRQLSGRGTFVIGGRKTNMPDTAWLITHTQSQLNVKPFYGFLTVRSQIAGWGNQFLVSGNSYKRNRPQLAILNNDRMEFPVEIDREGFVIDQLKVARDSSVEMVLSHNSKVGRLSEIQWIKGRYKREYFELQAAVSVFKNEFTPTKNFYRRYLHNAKLKQANDSTSILTFQVMTDSSFAINITNLDIQKNVVRWNKIITLPADLIQYDNILVDSNRIYILGRWLHVLSKGFHLPYYQYSFVQEVDLELGKPGKRYLLKSDRSLPLKKYTLESCFEQFSSSYQTPENIYVTYDGYEYFIIPKKF